jgi:isopentenyl phosphate kinase
LKLGGSLITAKHQAHTARPDVLARLAAEIVAALRRAPEMRLVLGHGSGSFGHIPARRYGTRQGVRTPAEWDGFTEVWREAAALNRLVVDALSAAGLPALAFPPSACVLADDGRVAAWELAPLRHALEAGRLPVVFGDVVFDRARGGTILSTEDLFEHLVPHLRPERVLLAGLEAGVWADFPACTRLLDTLTPATLSAAAPGLGGSAAPDVTGGMLAKVQQSLRMAAAVPGLEVRIFSGETPGAVARALAGEPLGTRLFLPD